MEWTNEKWHGTIVVMEDKRKVVRYNSSNVLLLLLYPTTFRLSSITTIVPCHFSFVHSIVCPSYYYYCTVPLFVCPFHSLSFGTIVVIRRANEKWYGTIVVIRRTDYGMDKRKVARYNSSNGGQTKSGTVHYCTAPLFVCPPLLLLYRTTFRLSIP
jgi:hypothetical protein